MVLMTIGEFSRLTRLSAKALRLYDRLGLLVPIEVDRANGNRYYSEEQVSDAVLVGLLRRLDMPLEKITAVLHAVGTDRAQLVRSYWDGVEKVSAERRELVDYLFSRLEGTPMTTRRIELRTVPERRVALISRHVLAPETDAFFHEAFAALRSIGPGLEGIAGTEPVVAEGIETTIEAPHDEAYVRLSKSELAWPEMRGVLDEIGAWTETNSRPPAWTQPTARMAVPTRYSKRPG